MPPRPDAAGQRCRVAQLLALAAEEQRELRDLAHALRMLRGELRAQVVGGKSHARRRLGLGLARVPAAAGEVERTGQHGRHERQQHQRDHELEQCESACAVHGGGLRCASLTVASESVRSPPVTPGNVTLAVTRNSVVGSVPDAASRSGLVSGGDVRRDLRFPLDATRLVAAAIGGLAQRLHGRRDVELRFGEEQRAAPVLGRRRRC